MSAPVPAKTLADLKKTYGDFKYVELGKGAIDIDDTWERDNIVTLRDVAGTGLSIRLHRLVAPLFEEALKEAIAACPDYKVRMLGGFVPRHKMHDPKRGLSLHSWGIAFDVNWDKNPVGGTKYDLPKAFIEAFEKRGWNWGGKWKGTKDFMHFQFAASF